MEEGGAFVDTPRAALLYSRLATFACARVGRTATDGVIREGGRP